ncbi:hypothetical protein [Bacillus sp. FJAT-26390]|uniref:hypothetical protein n=1 Tax=Bacillus sp. FJAT-26390 TaxID=1743142 RepID=UPI000807D0C0|nr:hypothetical protein [Bacillus sp. FJAT-26390]OBZ13208.1 hypothetical protein A7975_10065 [Bacillus sp. FJAT-26390]
MLEMIEDIEAKMISLQSQIRNRKSCERNNFSYESDNQYKILVLTLELEKWEALMALIAQYQKKRGTPITRKSKDFERTIQLQMKDVPGSIRRETCLAMIDYMKQLEWEIENKDEANGLSSLG